MIYLHGVKYCLSDHHSSALGLTCAVHCCGCAHKRVDHALHFRVQCNAVSPHRKSFCTGLYMGCWAHCGCGMKRSHNNHKTIKTPALSSFIYLTSLLQGIAHSHIRTRNSECCFYQLTLSLSFMTGPNTSYTEVGRGMYWWYEVPVGLGLHFKSSLPFSQTTTCGTLIRLNAKANTPSWACTHYLFPHCSLQYKTVTVS